MKSFVNVILLLFIVFSSCSEAKVYHISPNGNDANDGSEERPWKSLSKLNELSAGDTAILHGRFNEAVDLEVSGTKDAPISIIGANAVIDGSGVDRDGFVIRPNVSHVVIKRLRITNFNNHWALALYGNNSHITISDVEIDNSDTGIHLTAGYSGEQPMFGAVFNVIIENVRSHDNAIGGLDCTPGPCYNLIIVNSSFYNNGIQAGFGADGIAIEVGDNILIKGTTSMNNGGDGIDIGSRNPLFIRKSVNVTVRECIIANNAMQGLKLWSGGKAINCLIHSNGLEGLVLVYNGEYLIQHCDVVKNAFSGGYAFTSGYPEPEPLGTQDSLTVKIENSIFAFNGGENPVGIWISKKDKFSSENSIYFSREDEEIYFEDMGESITREEIVKLNGQNLALDPDFISLEGNEFHLKATSPAIDKGAVGAEIDLDYNPRPYGKGYDMGCYEFTPAPKLTPRTMVITPVKTITSATPAGTKSAIPGFEISLALLVVVSIAYLVGKRGCR
ncbi:MAG: right-handed parallel beta-helix repeat-containing protein [Archaeoglobaceae archaeon]